MALLFVFIDCECLLSIYTREFFLKYKMYGVHVESNFVLQN